MPNVGSVKEVIIQKKPETDRAGLGIFVFSDRYSVFDYGEMPDLIEEKGKSLCMISAHFFERMEEIGIKNHYLGVLEDNKIKKIGEVNAPSNMMGTEIFRVLKPPKNNGYDYSVYKNVRGNFLIPLEVIYRNALPAGSSVFKRIEKGEVNLRELGLKIKPMPGMKLEKPLLDVSTKLESEDRYLSWDEAKKISGMTSEELENMKETVLKINNLISSEINKAGLNNEDGKIEFAFNEKRELVVIDTVGTPDECRFSYNGFQLSKEVLRAYYRKTKWFKELEILKGENGWREKLGMPPRLDEEFKEAVKDMYKACCNEITGIKFFDVDKLGDVVNNIKSISEEIRKEEL